MIRGLDLAAPRPMPDRIAEAIRQAIVGGELLPGQRINESELAAAHAISRTPIREALRMLQQEGLVVVKPRRGAFVKPLGPEEALEVYAVKSMTEGFAARLATQRMSDQDLERLAGYFARMEREADQPTGQRYLEASRVFHDFIMEAARNGTLLEIYRGLERKIHWLRGLSLSRPDRIPASLAEHRAILDAMRRREAELAERLTRDHVERAGAELAPFLETLLAEAPSGPRGVVRA